MAALVLLIVALTSLDSLAVGQEPKRVFVLNSYHHGYQFSDSEMLGIADAFRKSDIKVETYITYMDMKRISPAPQYFSRLKELIREGYKDVHFDAIIVTDNDALEFMGKYRDELFPGVPVVFAGINDFDARMLNGRRDITGTIEDIDYAGTISIALKLRPATKNIVVVIDNTTTGKAHHSAMEKIRTAFPQSLGFTYLSLGDMTLDELAKKLSELKSDSIVLLLQHFVDRNGIDYTLEESTSLLAKSSSVPGFVVNDSRMGLGALGGDLVSGYSQGGTAAKMAVKILGGTDVRTIPVLMKSPNRYMFDYSVMQRFSIAESDLPPGSIVINKPFLILDRYRNELLLVLGILIILCAFIGYLLLQIRRRRQAEESRRESETLQRILLANLPAGVIIVDPVTRVIEDVNNAAAAMFGNKGEHIVGHRCHAFICPANEGTCPVCDLDLEVDNEEREMVCADGSRRPVLKFVKRIQIRGQEKLLECFLDITERKQAEAERAKLEDQLLQSQKMEAIGQLAGGVAHDFNNILAVIMGFGSLLTRQLKENDKGTQYVSQILQAADRAASLTQSLLAFGRKQHSNPKSVDLNSIIQKTEKILTRTIGEDIQLSLHLTEGNTSVFADSNQIAQILINLATNARDSMPKGGTLTIGTVRRFMDASVMETHGYGGGGEFVVMSVEDSGTGMDAVTRKRVFEPFFTTKEVGKGTGLGLSMVYGIVKQHNGYIDVYSEVGTGTAFKVYLPALEVSARTEEHIGYFQPEDATETILVVEDDSRVRRSLTEMLRGFGHTVIEACDGYEAVSKFLTHKDEIQLVLMDVIMPRKSGGDAYKEMKAIQPEIKIIFMSGYTEDYLAGKLDMAADVHFVPKPISPKELFEKMRSVLRPRED
jgi:PAS domain S-box-containing protein